MIFRYAIAVLLFLLVALPGIAPAQGAAQPLQVETSVSPTSGTIGDRLVLAVSVSVPEPDAVAVLMPDPEETTWTLVSETPQFGDAKGPDGKVTRTFRYTLIPFATGRLTVPRVAVTYVPANGTSSTVVTDPLWVEIDTVLKSADDRNLRDSYPPSSLPLPKPVVLSAFLLLGIILLVIAYLLWRRYAANLRKMMGRDLPPDERAIKEISRLEAERLIEQKKIKELFTRLADTMRHYVSDAYHVHAEDLTSTELLEILDELVAEVPAQHLPAYKQALARLTELLDEADLVKFARMQPEPAECRRALESGKEIVKLTRYRFIPEDKAPRGKDQRRSQAGLRAPGAGQ